MKWPTNPPMDVESALDKIKDGSDAAQIGARFDGACQLVQDQVSSEMDEIRKTHLKAYAIWLMSKKHRKLRDMALQGNEVEKSEQCEKANIEALGDLRHLLQESQTATVSKTYPDPNWVTAFIDEDSADYLFQRCESQPETVQEKRSEIERMAWNAIRLYRTLSRGADVADCYVTLAGLSEKLGEPASEGDFFLKAAEQFRQAALLEKREAGRNDLPQQADLCELLGRRTLGILDLTRGQLDEAASHFTAANKALASLGEHADDPHGVYKRDQIESFSLLIATFSGIVELQKSILMGNDVAIAGKITEVRGLVARFDESPNREMAQVAQMMLGSCEVNVSQRNWAKAMSVGDVGAAAQFDDQATRTLATMKSHASGAMLLTLRVQETANDMLHTIVEAERSFGHYQFDEAAEQWSSLAKEAADVVQSFEHELSLEIRPYVQSSIYLISGAAAMATPRSLHAKATRFAFFCNQDRAVDLLKGLGDAYGHARDILASAGLLGAGLQSLCSRWRDDVENLERLLTMVRDTRSPHLRMSASAQPPRCRVGGNADVIIKLKNDSDVPNLAAQCIVLIPDDFSISHPAAFTMEKRDGKNVLSWSGQITARATEELKFVLGMPQKPKTYFIDVVGTHSGGKESVPLTLEAITGVETIHLGFGQKVEVPEAAMTYWKLASYLVSGVIGWLVGFFLPHR